MALDFLAGGALQLVLAAVGGLACGFLNAAASCGSTVSMPLLMMLGLDPVTANATNRIPVLIGALSATGTFHRGGHVPWRLVAWLCPPLALGTLAGGLLAELLPSRDLGLAITAAILVALLLLVTKLKHALKPEPAPGGGDTANPEPAGRRPVKIWHLLLFFGIGLWLGCIVVEGATYMLLALLLVSGLTLGQGNAAKNAILIPITLLSLAFFAAEGSIDWRIGGVMAVGSILGGILGARLAVRPEARLRIYRLLVLVVIGELAHLVVHYIFKTAA